MNSRLDAYLAWQSEIGTAEVVMPAPWVKTARTASSTLPSSNPPDDPDARDDAPHAASASPSSRSSRASTTSPASAPASAASPEDFFRDIEKRLSEPARKPAAPKAAPASPSPIPAPAPAADFSSLEEYWTWLEAEYPRWFPSLSAPVARAGGRPNARLAVVEMFPAGGATFGGESGALLDKMMQAIGLSRDALYLTSVMKAPPPGKSWARKDVARALPSFLAELRLSGCGAVLLLGEACAQSVLRTGKSLAALEAPGIAEISVPEAGGSAFFAAWHPADLLRDAALKVPTWERLKILKSRLEGSPA
jgi:uracil-DNA glycosylase family 4